MLGSMSLGLGLEVQVGLDDIYYYYSVSLGEKQPVATSAKERPSSPVRVELASAPQFN